MSYNLGSKNQLINALDPADMESWIKQEVLSHEPELQELISKIVANVPGLCRFPQRALLLMPDCDRVSPGKGKLKYHSYPVSIKQRAKAEGVSLDSRPNGPAIAAFALAGGIRPDRHGSNNKWSIHHLYSGKFPYIGKSTTLHAAKACSHFTQSAGLVALHPIADALADESPAFTWLLRYRAYERFGYDPDHVFSVAIDEWGFDRNHPLP
jgi:hypothetical protein